LAALLERKPKRRLPVLNAVVTADAEAETNITPAIARRKVVLGEDFFICMGMGWDCQKSESDSCSKTHDTTLLPSSLIAS
jgi:hypothetical protein